MEILIGLIGAKGAGKTTAFKIIQSVMDVEEITLAKKLKEVCSSIFSIPRDHFDDHRYKEKNLEVPVYISQKALNQIYKAYGIDIQGLDYNTHFRVHIGKILNTPRQIAQYAGTEILRSIDEMIHCKNAVPVSDKKVGIITDLRFPEELDYFYNNSTRLRLIYISNLRAENYSKADTHVSESFLKKMAVRADKVIVNDAGLLEFEAAIKNYARGLASELLQFSID
jgi:hypothetical protein